MFLVLGLGLEHSCPWPRECLSSERLSLALALASDFFCVLGLGLGLEPCVLDSTSDHYQSPNPHSPTYSCTVQRKVASDFAVSRGAILRCQCIFFSPFEINNRYHIDIIVSNNCLYCGSNLICRCSMTDCAEVQSA